MEDVILEEGEVPGAYLPENPEDCTMTLLKRWLECHGLKKTGKRLELIERVKQAMSVGQPVDLKVDGGKWYLAKKEKILSQAGPSTGRPTFESEVPVIPSVGWRPFPSQNIPAHFNQGHIYYYVIESNSTDGICDESGSDDDSQGDGFTTTAKPLRKGQMLVKSKFIDNVQDNKRGGNYFLRAEVHHSMVKERPLQVSISMSSLSGSINAAQCNCKASTDGRCQHIAALLYYLLDFVSKAGYDVQAPSTSKPCTWGKGKKRKNNPKALHEASYSDEENAAKIYGWDPRPKHHQRKRTAKEENKFLIDIAVS